MLSGRRVGPTLLLGVMGGGIPGRAGIGRGCGPAWPPRAGSGDFAAAGGGDADWGTGSDATGAGGGDTAAGVGAADAAGANERWGVAAAGAGTGLSRPFWLMICGAMMARSTSAEPQTGQFTSLRFSWVS